jgi:recombination associated protein RdgC
VPTRLALTFDEKVSFVVTGSMELKQIALLETAAESSTDDKDAQARFNSELLLMAEELSRLFAALVAALGGHKTENQDEAPVAT